MRASSSNGTTPGVERQGATPRTTEATARSMQAMPAGSEIGRLDQELVTSGNSEQIQGGSGHASQIPPPEFVPMPAFQQDEESNSHQGDDEQISVAASSSARAPAPRSYNNGLPSKGTFLHAQGTCLPCRYHKHPDGCKVGADCKYCHHGHEEWSVSKAVKHFRSNIATYRAYYEPLLDDVEWRPDAA
eukprot:TRINITY_DN7471_c1_g1_i1.p1 TRINITY_DN7471_c1_g1~~TRINITY_DN7471_c1_g1_i1.p1  ORF type:complete len:188 (+),score=17.58 TRINITY_DN7471_c1_g1_i1:152-715(+)